MCDLYLTSNSLTHYIPSTMSMIIQFLFLWMDEFLMWIKTESKIKNKKKTTRNNKRQAYLVGPKKLYSPI